MSKIVKAIPLQWRPLAAWLGYVGGLVAILAAGYVTYQYSHYWNLTQVVTGTVLAGALWLVCGGALMILSKISMPSTWQEASETELVEVLETAPTEGMMRGARDELRRRGYFTRMQILSRHLRRQSH